MMLTVRRTLVLAALWALIWPASQARAQGVTTGSIKGVVTDAQNQAVPGATVLAKHEPSGSRYEAVTRADGRYDIPGMRVGGPYVVTVSLSGFQPETRRDVYVNLGTANDLDLTLRTVAATEEIVVTAHSDVVFNSERTGAATSVGRDALANLPTISDRLDSFARLTPQAGFTGLGMSFGGQDNRFNNITVDGSYFNNSFGLAGSPGERTNVSPISIAAIEEVQVSVAPYDVRQGNFVGAGVNTVTRSGTNQYRGSVYYWFRDQGLVGTEAKGLAFNPGTFDSHKVGGWISGPIVKDKLFFFASYEKDTFNQPGTTFRANNGNETVGGSVTRVRASDLSALSQFLSQSFQFDPGPFQDYPFKTPAKRPLAKLDYSMNDRNKLVFRYNQLDSSTDVLASNSSSLGFGNRRSNTTALNFAGSNYTILENIRSGVAEWNSIMGTNSANRLIVGYSHHDESRGALDTLFPFVDILDSGTTYTSFGSEPFTPNNELRYWSLQFQDSYTMHRGNHDLTFGGSAQRYKSENVFFPGAQSVYSYNSLADFYTDARGYLANPNRTTSPVTLRRFQVRWMNIPSLSKPIQPLQVWYSGVYGQDEWRATKNLKVIYGLRVDVASFGDTGFANADADARTFRDETGASVHYSSAKLPDASLLWSPRVGFNWDLTGDRRMQLRGGTGVFTGSPAYVWISNQIGNTGVLTGFEQLDNTTARPFNPNPDRYKPTTVTGAPASSYELALTDKDFRFPQLWRSNIAIDRKLPLGLTGTAEFTYGRDVNGIYYINANLPAPNSAFAGADTRSRWVNVAGQGIANRLPANQNIPDAVVLKNEDKGSSWNVSASLEKSFRAGFVKAAYSYGRSRNTVDPGSIAFGSWNNNPHPGDPNNPPVANSMYSPGHRFFAAGTYRFDYLKLGATTISLFSDWSTIGNASYVYQGDLNGDGGTSNDLIYIARNTSEMNFQTFTQGGRTFTADEQAQAWESYIQQDRYLSKHRGQYAQRGGVFLPMLFRTDLSVGQSLLRDIGGKRNELQFRVDILNFFNLLNSDWGVGQRLVATTASTPPVIASPLVSAGADAQGRALYRLRVVNNQLLGKSLESTSNINDVYRVQFSIRYNFN
jgi:Carboxypeptidase regulatory-like domain